MCSVKIQERQKALWSCCGRGLEAENYKWKVQTVTKLKFVLIFTLSLKVKRRYFCSKVWEDTWRTFKDATLDVLKGLNYTAYLWNTFCVKFHQKYIKTFYLNKSRRLQHPSNLVVRFVCSEEAKEVLTQCNFPSSTGCFKKCPKAMFVLGEPNSARSAVFLNIVQKAFAPPPPFVLNIMLQIFLMDFLKSA